MRNVLSVAVLVGLFGATAAQAAVVYSEDFTGQADGAAPSSGGTNWFTSGSTADTSARAQISAGVGNAGPSLQLADTSSSLGATAEVNFGVPSFSSFDTGLPGANQSTLTIGFDFRVDSFQSTNNSGSTLRVAIKDGNGTGTGADDRFFVFGFGRSQVNDGGAADNDLYLYAGGASAFNLSTVNDSNAIGLIPGTGWLPGFDFGQVAAGADDNNTDGLFYRIGLSFTGGEADVLVTATQLDANGALTGNTATKVVTVANPLALSNTGTDGIGFYSGNGGRGVMYVDNINFDAVAVAAVPEPSSLALVGIAGTALLARRRKR